MLLPAVYIFLPAIFLSDIFLFVVLPIGKGGTGKCLRPIIRRDFPNLWPPFVYVGRAGRLLDFEKTLRGRSVFALLRKTRLTQLGFSQRRNGANVFLEARLCLGR